MCSGQKMSPQKETSKLHLAFKVEFILINVFLKYHYQWRCCGGPVWGRSSLGQQVANEQSAHMAQRHHVGLLPEHLLHVGLLSSPQGPSGSGPLGADRPLGLSCSP